MINHLKRLGELALNAPGGFQHSRWYDYSGQWLAELDRDFRLKPGTAAGVCAALSPMNSWDIQLRDIPRILSLWGRIQDQSAIIGPGFFSNKRKATLILSGHDPLEVLSGDKVTRFFRNLRGDESVVTIDRHAASAAGWERSLTPAAYRRLEFAYSMAAESLGVSPAGLQAAIWVFWRHVKRA